MDRKLHWAAALLASCLASQAAQATCDSKCLERTLAGYLAQLVKHDPKPLKVSPQLIAVENAVATPLGQGSWQQIDALPAGQHFVDPVNGEAVYFGATHKAGGTGSIFLRLKVAGGAITESELLTKGGEPGFNDDVGGLLEPDILYDAVVPAARRSSRDGLVKVVGAYMDGVSQHNGAIVPVSYRCDRYSAGTKFTNDANHPVERGGGTCQTSMNNLKGQAVVNRRFAVVDVERGIVAALFVIPHGERTPPGATNVGEIFKVVDGKIRSIEEFSFVGGYPPSSGFADRP